MEKECVFCKIVKGEAPARKLYEGDTALSILDIGSVPFIETMRGQEAEFIPGRVLVISKRHVRWWHDLNYKEAAESFKIARNAAKKIKKAFNPEFVDFIIRGGRVPHFHAILHPEFADDPHRHAFRVLESAFRPKLPDDLLDDWFDRLKSALR